MATSKKTLQAGSESIHDLDQFLVLKILCDSSNK